MLELRVHFMEAHPGDRYKVDEAYCGVMRPRRKTTKPEEVTCLKCKEAMIRARYLL